MSPDMSRVQLQLEVLRRSFEYARVPEEIWDVIHSHASAACIQTAFRSFMFRHVHRSTWPALRRELIHASSMHELTLLFRNGMVRQEWRQEPGSWLSELRLHETSTGPQKNLGLILKEIQEGYWTLDPDTPSHH